MQIYKNYFIRRLYLLHLLAISDEAIIKQLEIMELYDKNSVWYAVVNIFAASKKAGKSWHKAEACLLRDSVPYISARTGEHGNAMNLTCAACAEGYRKFIAVGGDGTVHDVVEGIMIYIESRNVLGEKLLLSDFTLAVIPVGSGNDWIKTSGVPRDIVKAASLFKNGAIARQDVVRVTTYDPAALQEGKVLKLSYMTNVGGIGIDARVCQKVNKEKKRGKRGKWLYVSALLYHISHRVPLYAKVMVDGKEIFNGSFFSIAFGIGKYSGGGMRQTPDAIVDDGLLDMSIIPDLPIAKIAKEAPKLFTDKFTTVKELVVARGKQITVLSYDPGSGNKIISGDMIELDGEIIGNAPAKFEILPSQLNILTTKGQR